MDGAGWREPNWLFNRLLGTLNVSPQLYYNCRMIAPEDKDGFARLYKIVRDLRSPDGCPWDREQTPESLRAALIEEAYEAVDAINDGDPAHVREELGDHFLMGTMVAYMYEQAGIFSVNDVLQEVCEKLVRRHPHVYGDAVAGSSDQVVAQWQQIKETVEGRKKNSVLDQVSHALPPLERAYKLQKKAAKVGFDWTEAEPVWDKIAEELEETRAAWEHRRSVELSAARANEAGPGADGAAARGPEPIAEGRETVAADGKSPNKSAQEHLEEELGDLLFSVVNVARFLKLDPAVALQRSIGKFEKRFRYVEKEMAARGRPMGAETFVEMDALWDAAKKEGI